MVEAYGITETLASDVLQSAAAALALLPAASVWPLPDASIMDAEGNLVPPGSLGEVVIRGRNVTEGYEGAIQTPMPRPAPMADFAPAIRAY